MKKTRRSMAGERVTPRMAERQRRAYNAGWALKSLEKNGPGTVGDLVERNGGEVGYYEMELALQRLLTEKCVRRVKKEYGWLFVVKRKKESASKSAASQSRDGTTAREKALALLRSAGSRGMLLAELKSALDWKRQKIWEVLNKLATDGLVRRTFYDGRKSVWTAAEFTPERGASTRDESRRVKGGGALIELLSEWKTIATAAEELNLTPEHVRLRMRRLRDACCVESRMHICPDGRMRKQWRALVGGCVD